LARHALTLAGVGDEVTVARGGSGTLSGDRPVPAVETVERYWGEAVEPLSTPAGDALSLLEIARPGLLASAPLVVMGGYTGLSPAGYPEWGPNMDWNVQSDQAAARLVFERCNPIVVPLSATVQTYLTESDLKRFEGAGPLADLIAKQARAYADKHAHRKLAGENVSLPSGFLNFQHDALAVAVALGWQGASIVDRSMRPELRDGSLLLAPGGQNLRVVTAVDAAGLAGRFVESVMRIT
jgi:inosine-uridine nucleoside N-ribohydrolase